ncbi:hypothetical protein C0Z16_09785 [Paraburkholderia rhynchosiae]|uniref:Uncharacterized protein n=1 Tax=Paraburkholderia rhynchosiae TaxID=487049 RepID=A0ABX4V8B8_9BURK|nr:hypothetical protein C0Z16_09785 [Paraburkholderia rhynchosiae]
MIAIPAKVISFCLDDAPQRAPQQTPQHTPQHTLQRTPRLDGAACSWPRFAMLSARREGGVQAAADVSVAAFSDSPSHDRLNRACGTLHVIAPV